MTRFEKICNAALTGVLQNVCALINTGNYGEEHFTATLKVSGVWIYPEIVLDLIAHGGIPPMEFKFIGFSEKLQKQLKQEFIHEAACGNTQYINLMLNLGYWNLAAVERAAENGHVPTLNAFLEKMLKPKPTITFQTAYFAAVDKAIYRKQLPSIEFLMKHPQAINMLIRLAGYDPDLLKIVLDRFFNPILLLLELRRRLFNPHIDYELLIAAIHICRLSYLNSPEADALICVERCNKITNGQNTFSDYQLTKANYLLSDLNRIYNHNNSASTTETSDYYI